MTDSSLHFDARPRLLVVGVASPTLDAVRRRFASVETVSARNPFEAMTESSAGQVCAALVQVSPGMRHAAAAIGSLRELLGPNVPLVLCCEPAAEPAARRLLDAGASDYVIDPPTGPELDHVLGLEPAGPYRAAPEPPAAAPSLDRLTDILRDAGQSRRTLLERAAGLVAETLRATGVAVCYDGLTVRAGAAFEAPAFSEPIRIDGEVMGRIDLGPRGKPPFGSDDLEQLRDLSRFVAQLLQLADAQQRWRRLAHTDDLSGVGNRRFLKQSLDGLLERARREQFRVTLLLFDIDDFKRYNDQYGHAVGDGIIRDTAQLIRQNCRKHDLLSRFGGDEFAVVFWDAERPRMAGSRHPADAVEVLNRFRAALESHQFPSLGPEAVGTLTISGGLASFPWDARTADELICRADDALLAAKRAGKNCIYLIGGDDINELTDDQPLSSD